MKNHRIFNILNFKWVKDTSKINEEFIKNYNENSKKGYTLEVDVKLINVKNSFVIYIKKRIRRTYKVIKTSIKSWIKIKKHS